MAFQLAKLVADIAIRGGDSTLSILEDIKAACQATFNTINNMTQVPALLPALAGTSDSMQALNASTQQVNDQLSLLEDIFPRAMAPAAINHAISSLEQLGVAFTGLDSSITSIANEPSLIPITTVDDLSILDAVNESAVGLLGSVDQLGSTAKILPTDNIESANDAIQESIATVKDLASAANVDVKVTLPPETVEPIGTLTNATQEAIDKTLVLQEALTVSLSTAPIDQATEAMHILEEATSGVGEAAAQVAAAPALLAASAQESSAAVESLTEEAVDLTQAVTNLANQKEILPTDSVQQAIEVIDNGIEAVNDLTAAAKTPIDISVKTDVVDGLQGIDTAVQEAIDKTLVLQEALTTSLSTEPIVQATEAMSQLGSIPTAGIQEAIEVIDNGIETIDALAAAASTPIDITVGTEAIGGLENIGEATQEAIDKTLALEESLMASLSIGPIDLATDAMNELEAATNGVQEAVAQVADTPISLSASAEESAAAIGAVTEEAVDLTQAITNLANQKEILPTDGIQQAIEVIDGGIEEIDKLTAAANTPIDISVGTESIAGFEDIDTAVDVVTDKFRTLQEEFWAGLSADNFIYVSDVMHELEATTDQMRTCIAAIADQPEFLPPSALESASVLDAVGASAKEVLDVMGQLGAVDSIIATDPLEDSAALIGMNTEAINNLYTSMTTLADAPFLPASADDAASLITTVNDTAVDLLDTVTSLGQSSGIIPPVDTDVFENIGLTMSDIKDNVSIIADTYGTAFPVDQIQQNADLLTQTGVTVQDLADNVSNLSSLDSLLPQSMPGEAEAAAALAAGVNDILEAASQLQTITAIIPETDSTGIIEIQSAIGNVLQNFTQLQEVAPFAIPLDAAEQAAILLAQAAENAKKLAEGVAASASQPGILPGSLAEEQATVQAMVENVDELARKAQAASANLGPPVLDPMMFSAASPDEIAKHAQEQLNAAQGKVASAVPTGVTDAAKEQVQQVTDAVNEVAQAQANSVAQPGVISENISNDLVQIRNVAIETLKVADTFSDALATAASESFDAIITGAKVAKTAIGGIATGIGYVITGFRTVASSAGFNLPTVAKGQEQLNSMGNAIGGIFKNLSQVAGIDLHGAIQGLAAGGILAAASASIFSIIRGSIELSDKLYMLGSRFKSMGMDAESSVASFQKFSFALAETASINRGAAASLMTTALQRGPDPSKYQEVAQAATAIAAKTGMSNEQVIRMVNLGEENYKNYQRLLKWGGMIVPMHASQADIMARVNDLIRQGTEMQKDQAQTFGATATRLHTAWDGLTVAIGMAIGPPLKAMLIDAMSRVIQVVDRVKDWANEHKGLLATVSEIAGRMLLMGGSIMVFVTALNFGLRVFGALRIMSLTMAGINLVLKASFMSVATAIRGVWTATGAGVFVVLATAALQASGVLDRLAEGTLNVKGIFEGIYNYFKGIIAPVFRFVYVEFMLMYTNLVTGFQDIYANAQEAFGGLMAGMSLIGQWMADYLGPVWDEYVKPLWDSAYNYIEDFWVGFNAFLANAGLQMKIWVLKMTIEIKAVPGYWEWLKAYLGSFGVWFIDNFVGIIISSLKLLVTQFAAFTKVWAEMASQVWNSIRGKGFSFDAIHTSFKEGMDKVREEAKNVVKDLNLPSVDKFVKGPTEEEKNKIIELQKEMDKRVQDSIAAQAAQRARLGKDFDDMMNKEKEKRDRSGQPELKGGIPLRAGFGDLMGVWKKLQEQVAGGTMNEPLKVAKDQLTQNIDTNRNLVKLRDAVEAKKPAAPGVPVPP